MPDLLTALRDHLISEDIVRNPRTAGMEPPMWLEPRDGVPAPTEGADATEVGDIAVVGAFITGGIPARPYYSMLRKDVVDIWIRTTNAPAVHAIEASIRGALIDKRAWDMAGLTVVESLQWRPLQRLGSDSQAFTFITSYIFELYAT